MKVKIEYRIIDYMRERNLSERKLAELSGVGRSSINRIINNKVNPRLDAICMLALALEVRVEELFNYESVPL